MPFVIDDIIGLVGLTVAVPGLVQVFVHSARWLSKKLQDAPPFLDNNEIQDFIIAVDSGTIRTTLETIEDVCLDTNNAVLRNNLEAQAKKLWPFMVELDELIRKLKSTAGNEKQAKRIREKTLKAVENMRNLESHLRSEVKAHVNLSSVRSRFELRDTHFGLIGNSQGLEYSAVNVGRGEFNIGDRRGELQCFLEQKTYQTRSDQDAYARAVDLARSMQFFEASNGLPELVGFQHVPSPALVGHQFEFVFTFPKHRVNPRSFRDILLDPVNTPLPPIPRNFRFILPRVLAEAVYQVHEQQLVHKCIRPESILLFEPAPGDTPDLKYPKTIGAPVLTDWKYTRELTRISTRGGLGDWTLAMYQHPERQALPGEDIEVKYHIGHDIYSLGICLLEIGLWQSFIVYETNIPKLSQLLSDAKEKWKRDNSAVWPDLEEAQIEQKVYIMLAGDRLAYEMGEAYSKLVVKCLTCVEKGFGNVRLFKNHQSREWEEQGILFAQEIRRSLHGASTMGSGIYNTL